MSFEAISKSISEINKTNDSNDKPDFSECFESVQQIGDKSVAVLDDVLGSYLSSHMDYLKERFASVLQGPEAEKFAAFFADCQDKALADEPAYAMMFGDNKVTHLT